MKILSHLPNSSFGLMVSSVKETLALPELLKKVCGVLKTAWQCHAHFDNTAQAVTLVP